MKTRSPGGFGDRSGGAGRVGQREGSAGFRPGAAARPEDRPPFPVGIAVGFYAALCAAAVLWRVWADGVLPLAPPGAAAGGLARELVHAVLGAAAGAALVVATRRWTRLRPSGERLARAMAELIGPLSNRAVVALALASGLAEEAFFRGALQPRVGWLAASVLFALAHLVPRREWLPWSGFALLAGLLFGALFELSGSLVAPAVAHVWVNGANLRWLADSVGADPERAGGPTSSAPVAKSPEASALDGRDRVDLDGGAER